MKMIFNHLFYRTYWWNIKIIREKDFPALSAFIFVSIMMQINLLTIIFGILFFVFNNTKLFPSWGHWCLMVIILTYNYFVFIRDKKYKTILEKSEKIIKPIKKKEDVIIILYLILSFLSFILLANLI